MTDVVIKWTKVKELPTQIDSWADIKYYAGREVEFPKDRCVYCIRLSPPYMIHYAGPSKHGADDDFVSPLIYVGSGNARGRLGSHLSWLNELGSALPGGRYEVWIAQPRVKNSGGAYAAFEGFLLHKFHEVSRGWLPLRNQRLESFNPRHTYSAELFDELIDHDRRYTWAIWPWRGKWWNYYMKGGKAS